MADRNRALFESVVHLLAPLLDELVFVGGSMTGLFITDPAAGGIRPTRDVDAIVDVTSYAEYTALAERLRALGLGEDTTPGAPLCRWRQGHLIVDIMPTDATVLGFSNRWYPVAIDTAETFHIAGHDVRVVTPALFIATKLEAFRGRGGNDVVASHDLEDIIAVVDGRPEIVDDVRAASTEVRDRGGVRRLSGTVGSVAQEHREMAGRPQPRRARGMARARGPRRRERGRRAHAPASAAHTRSCSRFSATQGRRAARQRRSDGGEATQSRPRMRGPRTCEARTGAAGRARPVSDVPGEAGSRCLAACRRAHRHQAPWRLRRRGGPAEGPARRRRAKRATRRVHAATPRVARGSCKEAELSREAGLVTLGQGTLALASSTNPASATERMLATCRKSLLGSSPG